MSFSEENEPLLRENSSRFVIFPIQYEDVWKMYKRAEASFWTTAEVDLGKDKPHWGKAQRKREIFHITRSRFFSRGGDGIVAENLATRFCRDVQIPEARFFYGFQMMMENIHSEMYSLLIDTYIEDSQEKHRLFKAVETIPVIKKKADWALKWINDSRASFATRLVAFAVVEGIFLFRVVRRYILAEEKGSDAGSDIFPTNSSVGTRLYTAISRVLLFSYLESKPSEETVSNIVREAVNIEREFMTEALKCSLIGMNERLMGQYVEFVADRLLAELGYSKLYRATNPFQHV